jgi:hypothetical protein
MSSVFFEPEVDGLYKQLWYGTFVTYQYQWVEECVKVKRKVSRTGRGGSRGSG